MDIRILEDFRESTLRVLSDPGSLQTHHLIITAMAAGYLLSFAMSRLPSYFRPVCRYAAVFAMLAVLREDIADNMPGHRDLFAKVNAALEEVVR